MMAAITTMLMTGLISSSPYAFGVPPEEGFLGCEDCKLGGTQGNKMVVKCCWHADDGTNYCQTCVFVYEGEPGQGKYETCNPSEFKCLIYHQIIRHPRPQTL